MHIDVDKSCIIENIYVYGLPFWIESMKYVRCLAFILSFSLASFVASAQEIEWKARPVAEPPGGWRFVMASTGCTLVSQPVSGVTVTLSDTKVYASTAFLVTGEGQGGKPGTKLDIVWQGVRGKLTLVAKALKPTAAGALIDQVTDPLRLAPRLLQEESSLIVGGQPKIWLASVNLKVLQLFSLCMRDGKSIPDGFSYGEQEARAP